MAMTIYERYGGFSTVRKIVSTFYDKVLDSERLQKYFADVDVRKLIDHQTQFIASVMGGPASFTDDTLKRVHERLGISHAEFEEAVGLLGEALEELDVDPADIDFVQREVKKREAVIVTRRD